MSDPATLRELIARLEKATGPDRELDRLIQEARGICTHRKFTRYVYQDDSGFTCNDCGEDLYGNRGWPAFTSSIDAAVSLVPEGRDWLVGTHQGAATAVVTRADDEGNWVVAATPVLALCIAALHARLTEMEASDDR